MPTVEAIEQELLAALGRLTPNKNGVGVILSEADITRVEKPWGYELHWAKTERYVGKTPHTKKKNKNEDVCVFLETAIRDGEGEMKRESGRQPKPPKTEKRKRKYKKTKETRRKSRVLKK